MMSERTHSFPAVPSDPWRAQSLRLSFSPSPLVVDYDGGPIARTAVAVVPAGALVIALRAPTLWTARRRPWRGFLGAWFFLVLGLTTSDPPLVEYFAAERRMYIPVAAVVTLVVIAGTRRWDTCSVLVFWYEPTDLPFSNTPRTR